LNEGAVRKVAAMAAQAFSMWLWAWALLALPPFGATARAADPLRIPVVFHVAQVNGEAVAPESFIAEQLAAANAIYGPRGIELVQRESIPLHGKHAELVTRTDRDALLRYVQTGAIHCFVVARLMDVDEPGRERRGVHWRPRPAPQRTFLIVSKISKSFVLAHELGHLFGNRTHSDVPGNLMSYKRWDGPRVLDEAQIQRVRSTLAVLLKLGTIVPLEDVQPGTP
jgi:hypothetical protein